MSINELITAIQNGDLEEARELAEAILGERLLEAIEDRKIAVASEMFNEGKSPYEKGKDEVDRLENDGKSTKYDDGTEEYDDDDEEKEDSDEDGETEDGGDDKKEYNFGKKKKSEDETVKESLDESFKRGDVLHVPGADGTKHVAVHLGNKAVYLNDDGTVEHVPGHALKKASKAPKVTTKHKSLAYKYLENMKESLDDYSLEEIKDFMMSEEFEQLDELSKTTLKNYVKKSADDFPRHQRTADEIGKKSSWNEPMDKGQSKALDKVWNRKMGIHRAVDKLAKESIDEAKAQPADHVGARELHLYGINSSDHHKQAQYMIDNLKKKVKRGVYDHEKATKLWKYHADHVAKSYAKEHGGSFSPATRMVAAQHFRDHYDEHVRGD